MRLVALRLAHFRNYAEAEIQPDPALNLVVGPNAQGKTNLLEAIWVLGGARSPRVADQGQLVRFGAERAMVRATLRLDGSDSLRELRLELGRGGARSFYLNDKAVHRHADILGTLALLWFSPDEVDVIRGGPSHRRRFLDLTLAQADPLYREALVRYTRVVQQRNRLLRARAPRGELPAPLLEAWDEQLAGAGAELVARRLSLLQQLEPAAAGVYRAMADGDGPLSLRYRSAVDPSPADPADEQALRGRLLGRIRALRAAELARGVTLVGPHRDDVAILLGSMDLRHFGSRGQQRTAAVALFVAAWRWMRDRMGEAPVLLLDDVASELDERRRQRLLEVIPPEAQVFITATEPDALPASGEVARRSLKVWRVSAGRLELVSGR